MPKTNLETWTKELDALNTERAELVYRLRDEAGHDPGDWGALAQVHASPHPELDAINARIRAHVAARPVAEDQAVADFKRDYQELLDAEKLHNDPDDPRTMTPDQQQALARYRAMLSMGKE